MSATELLSSQSRVAPNSDTVVKVNTIIVENLHQIFNDYKAVQIYWRFPSLRHNFLQMYKFEMTGCP